MPFRVGGPLEPRECAVRVWRRVPMEARARILRFQGLLC